MLTFVQIAYLFFFIFCWVGIMFIWKSFDAIAERIAEKRIISPKLSEHYEYCIITKVFAEEHQWEATPSSFTRISDRIGLTDRKNFNKVVEDVLKGKV